MQVEFVLLVLSLLFFASIFTDRIGYRFGVPALMVFLIVGMLFGQGGLGVLIDGEQDYGLTINAAQAIGTIALCVILFTGGLDTKVSDIQPVIAPGITLATVGVFLTCVITGLLAWVVFGWIHGVLTLSVWSALLMAATMSSTDSASVFSILRTNNVKLKHNLRPLLELESGANDPMAYILTITLITIVTSPTTDLDALDIFRNILIQLVMGAVIGFIFGKVVIWLLNKGALSNESLYPVMVLTACIFIFSVTYYLQGNPYLAVYMGGLIIGNSRFYRKRQTKAFFDGLTWLSQLVMFLMLGLMANVKDLLDWKVWTFSLIVSLIMTFVARPLSVWLCLLPFKQFKQNDRIFVSWVGLKGAVPIIFAILCEAAEVPQSDLLFNVVFACTLISLLIQGTTLGSVASKLKLVTPQTPEHKLRYFDIDLPDEIQSSSWEKVVDEKLLSKGNKLKDLTIQPHTLVIMVKRDDTFFVPTGETELKLGDQLLVISDNNAQKAVQDMEEEEAEILTHWWMDFVAHTGNFMKVRWRKLVENGRKKKIQ